MANLRIINANIFTPLGRQALKGEDMGYLHHIANGEIEIIDGIIAYVGHMRECAGIDSQLLDAKGCAVLPGFVDSHTHMVFGGYRPDEFMWRMRGDSYMSIMERGGGIVNTMKATREAPKRELIEKTRWYIDEMSRMGVTTVEGKSGYGLDEEAEIKQLEVMAELNADPERKVDIVTTYLGGHALPPEYKEKGGDAYIDFMIEHMLPKVKGRVECCDIFCEKGVFSIEQSRRMLKAAQEAGLAIKIHADEIVTTGGAELAAELGALSADHLLHISEQGIADLGASHTVATLLPLTAFALREPYAPGRKMIDAGCAVALATDLNPGSCYSCSIPLMIALACIYMHFTVEEAISALTINGAAALGHADSIGSIEIGKKGDLAILCSDNINILPYYTGMNCVTHTVKGGKVVSAK